MCFLCISWHTWWKYSLGVPQTGLTLATLHRISILLAFDWPYAFHAFGQTFGIIMRDSSDLIGIWSYFVEFPSSSDCLSTCRTFPDKLLMGFCENICWSSPYIWSPFGHASLHFQCLLTSDQPSTFYAFLDKLLDSNRHPHVPRLYQIWV